MNAEIYTHEVIGRFLTRPMHNGAQITSIEVKDTDILILK
jgi:hypothetical protein